LDFFQIEKSIYYISLPFFARKLFFNFYVFFFFSFTRFGDYVVSRL
jgi:hypothetical protein